MTGTIRRALQLALVPAASLALLLSALSPAQAAPATAAEPSAATGSVALFSNADFTGSAWTHHYTACTHAASIVPPLGRVRSFDNRPATGCRVALHSPGGRYDLCVGRGVVPLQYQSVTRVVIESGASRQCSLV